MPTLSQNEKQPPELSDEALIKLLEHQAAFQTKQEPAAAGNIVETFQPAGPHPIPATETLGESATYRQFGQDFASQRRSRIVKATEADAGAAGQETSNQLEKTAEPNGPGEILDGISFAPNGGPKQQAAKMEQPQVDTFKVVGENGEEKEEFITDSAKKGWLSKLHIGKPGQTAAPGDFYKVITNQKDLETSHIANNEAGLAEWRDRVAAYNENVKQKQAPGNKAEQ